MNLIVTEPGIRPAPAPDIFPSVIRDCEAEHLRAEGDPGTGRGMLCWLAADHDGDHWDAWDELWWREERSDG